MIVTLCGSARYESEFKKWNERLTLAGHVVFSLAVYPSDKPEGKDWYTKEQKRKLDEAHIEKIRASDAILVVGDGYMGESTRREVAFAITERKKRFYVWYPPHYDTEQGVKVCPYAGCADPLSQRPPCFLCYE